MEPKLSHVGASLPGGHELSSAVLAPHGVREHSPPAMRAARAGGRRGRDARELSSGSAPGTPQTDRRSWVAAARAVGDADHRRAIDQAVLAAQGVGVDDPAAGRATGHRSRRVRHSLRDSFGCPCAGSRPN